VVVENILVVHEALRRGWHEAPVGEAVWQDTRLRGPGFDAQQTWRHVFTGEPVRTAMEDGQPALAVAELLAQFPVALLMA
jgi:(1->4)-alpha-D-glucan 1-alpha-D-glucosylmutase